MTLVGPAAVLVAAVVGTGLLALVLTATGLMPLAGQPRFSLDAFTSQAPDLLTSARESLLISMSATTISAAVGLAVALLLVRADRLTRWLTAAAAAPVPVAHIVGAASFALLLSDSGIARRAWGSVTTPWPELVGGPWPVAIVAEFAWKESAFVALVITASVAPRLQEYLEAASMLGAGAGARLRHVTLPLAAPALYGTGVIVFLYTLGSYEVAWVLGAAYPESLPVMAYRLFGSIDVTTRPQAAAVALTTTLMALGAAAASAPLIRRVSAR
ncbi:ABC transporter permease subunit [Terrabacter carboxydivorans]|uniref:ABC transporter permease subunit n=1 Tax=Terrabacter carboxydivorans TaxID=619730 RepID=A0ABP5ZXJ4_9MICO